MDGQTDRQTRRHIAKSHFCVAKRDINTYNYTQVWLSFGGRGILKRNCFYATLLCTVVMVHKGMSSSYRSVDCIGL